VQNIVVDKPYRFVPPHHGSFWPNVLRWYLPRYLRKHHGLASAEFLGLDRLRASLGAGHGIILAPNHCRPGDPMALGLMGAALSQPLYAMASWHLFAQGRLYAWLLRQLADLYLAQQLSLYPPDYFSSPPTPEQLLETVERFEEDLTDRVRVYRPLHAVIEVGDAIEVGPTRQRGADGDPVMVQLRAALTTMLAGLKERGRR
jgi:hypothetical protein